MDFLDAVFISFWHQIEVFIDKFSLWSLNLSPEDTKCNFWFWVLVPTVGTVYWSFFEFLLTPSWPSKVGLFSAQFPLIIKEEFLRPTAWRLCVSVANYQGSHMCRLGYDRVIHPPPMKFFLSQSSSPWKLLDTPGPKIPYLGHFSGLSGVSGNTWQLPGVSRGMTGVSKKNFPAGKFFFWQG